ncbi:putative ATP-grasp-modified RiPP [Streptomyces sp. SID13031]|uniref:putative ATP-grasp-modified RiPP n=1 Tax=Streptomyces sp. SID13031 TaxID=2706046 RepID=UPI0013CA255D|nr:putative ATP-grasp-modified RiPP [Streptomyces sp. SID13031]NEA31846.1 putative ATP-grasp-modified RiPP [Streptomyces sp. SID13031]
MTTTQVPFGARVQFRPYQVTLEGGSFRYDVERQVNVMTDGTLLCEQRLPQSCTGTNWDSKPDDTADPYLLVG